MARPGQASMPKLEGGLLSGDEEVSSVVTGRSRWETPDELVR